MTSLICVVRAPDDLQKLIDFCGKQGAQCETVGLPRHALVTGLSADTLRELDFVKSVDIDQVLTPSYQAVTIPADLGASGQSWALARTIRRRPPWRTDRAIHPIHTFFDCVRDGTGVDIYMFDTGVRVAHDEFAGRATIVYEYSSAGADGDDHGHGTTTASCAAGATVGFARGANVRSFRIATSSAGSATTSSLISAMGAALTAYNSRSNPAVGNVSYTFSSATVLSAIADLIDAGMIIVGSAGNASTDLATISEFPAEATDAICAAAVDMMDRPATWLSGNGTNYGSSSVSICSPGHYFPAASHTGNSSYLRTSGATSCAAAYTTGVIACMLQGHSKLTSRAQVQAVKAALLANATDGRLVIPASSHVPAGGLPDAILYLDPYQTAPEPIPGLS